jgi:hypothetical protein
MAENDIDPIYVACECGMLGFNADGRKFRHYTYRSAGSNISSGKMYRQRKAHEILSISERMSFNRH